MFARHFFIQRGVSPRKIKVVRNPQGKGSGEQFVRSHYPNEVRAYRSKSTYLTIGLAVVTDADTLTVAQRRMQLSNALAESNQMDRRSDEQIAIYVPRRNIETWIHYLEGRAVDPSLHVACIELARILTD
ncbi:MAG: hypothetical protein AB1791_08430 [Chloroflexota bacterium]